MKAVGEEMGEGLGRMSWSSWSSLQLWNGSSASSITAEFATYFVVLIEGWRRRYGRWEALIVW